jgi:hypothetical protein
MIEVKAFRTFIRIYSLFISERLSASIKLTLQKALIRSEITYSLSHLGISGKQIPLRIAAPTK